MCSTSDEDTNKMDSSTAPTNIWDLDDNCLIEAFQYFDLKDLAAIIDVCQRFREHAQRRFSSKKFNKSNLGSHLDDILEKRNFLALKSILRRFGQFLNSLKLDMRIPLANGAGEESEICEIQMQIVEPLIEYCCSGALSELTLHSWRVTDEIVEALFQQITKVNIMKSDFSGHFLQKSLHNLTTLSLKQCLSITSDDIDEIMKNNPELKKVCFNNCYRLDDRVYQSVANHVPRIESISSDILIRENENKAKYFGKFSKLKSLEWFNFEGINRKFETELEFERIFSSILQEIIAADIPLEYLHVVQGRCTDQYVDEISMIKTLKVLRFDRLKHADHTGIIRLCQNLPELTELCVQECTDNPTLSSDSILQIIKNANKLQSLYCYVFDDLFDDYTACSKGKMFIDGDEYMKMVKIVQRRRQELHLAIKLGSCRFALNIPQQLAGKYSMSLTVDVCQDCNVFCGVDAVMRCALTST